MEEREAFAALVRKTPGYLDRPIEDLVKMQAVGSVFLDAHRSILRKIKAGQIELAEEDRQARLAEGTAIGEALLEVEAKIGTLSLDPKLNVPKTRHDHLRAGGDDPPPPKYERMGFGKRQLSDAQAIAKARDDGVVAQVIAEAREHEDIPTKTAVFAKIRQLRAEKALAQEKAKKIKTEVKHELKRVSRYFDAVKYFRDELEIAVEAAKQDSFSPESIHLLRRKHEELRGLMEKLEKAVE